MNSKWIRSALALATLGSSLVLMPVTPAAANGAAGGELYEPSTYSVKFLCGYSKGEIVSKGHYTTALNVHNFGQESTVLRLHSAQAGDDLSAGPVSKTLEWAIGPGQVIVITCEDIWWLNRHDDRDDYKHKPCEDKKGHKLPPKKCKKQHYYPFFDGFVVLDASADLQVIALNNGEQVPVDKMQPPNGLG
jgi:hypothetical protein